MKLFILTLLIISFALKPFANGQDEGVRAFEKDNSPISPSDEKAIRDYWKGVETNMREQQELARAEVQEERDSADPQLQFIKAKLLQAEQSVLAFKKWGRYIAIVIASVLFLATYRMCHRELHDTLASKFASLNRVNWNAVLAGIFAILIYSAIAKSLFIHSLMPFLWVGAGRIFAASADLAIAVTGFAVAGFYAGRTAKRNAIESSLMAAITIVVINTWLICSGYYLVDLVISWTEVVLIIPVVVCSAIRAKPVELESFPPPSYSPPAVPV